MNRRVFIATLAAVPAAGAALSSRQAAPPGALEEIFADHIKPLSVPAWFGGMIGHQTPQWTLPVGAEVEIGAATGTIRMLAPAVR